MNSVWGHRPRRGIIRRGIILHLVRISILLPLAVFAGVSKAPAQFAVGVSITVAPPALPVYEQPPIPAPGYIWTPGYWTWDDGDYYWVPGTWVQPPHVGLLWTPGYWGWHDGVYGWNAGYWGPHVGFYGGVNYGFGYGGVGFEGGVWRGGVFSYNSTVNNFGSVNITNVYSKTVITNNVTNNVSFNGGAGGTTAKATPAELAAAKEPHVQPTQAQVQHQHLASADKSLRASNNGGHPAVAATSHAGHFSGEGVVAAHAHPGDAGGAGKSPGALNANHATGGNNTPKKNNASLNTGHTGDGKQPGPQHRGGEAAHNNSNNNGAPAGNGNPQGGKGGGAPPKVTSVAHQPRPPAPPRPAAHPKEPPHHQ